MKDPKKIERTEEVQEIIERMPHTMGFKITGFVLFIVIIFFSLGWLIKYPDVVTGGIVINASSGPIKLVSNFSGKIRLNGFKSSQQVKQGDYIAVIENPSSSDDMQRIIKLIDTFRIKDGLGLDKLSQFPRDVSLGELNTPYYKFLNAFNQLTNYRKSNLYDKQADILAKLSVDYKHILEVAERRLKMSSKTLDYVRKFESRDSTLYSKRVLAESENDRTQMSSINAKDNHQQLLKEIYNTQSQIEQAENQRQQNELQKFEKEKQLMLDLINGFSELEAAIKLWEQRYVFKAPITGGLQFLKFLNNGQYVQTGEAIFTIVPEKNRILGQMTLPATGAGKVSTGQEVIIKLEDYPYTEYGSIKGLVSSVSMTTNSITTKEGTLETYLVNIDLPDQLKTNYGSRLNFKFEIKGTGDIITDKRRLLERLFDNLKYKLKE
ncbi:HlyD family efflux transporter periplasmic adaptor subunit [Pedobacter riviphilus]|uniref:HlyD family efflux transporter periplasmic adaptor subunit n=1 Tax=Pedobacter riviphilus TaxID=2766984 RepID=A0ABX6TNJ3_9SPHI|nr:HlyD family efflux transporter periplasmic adaptor subunit [Pedobacter riviphilus]QNR86781.1 HlyD family efflux transporter periplasmic adaptor subunit [Pedobacter riviphilus]